MTLARAQVIDAVAALLVPMAATAGRVYTDRTYPLDQSELPAWRVLGVAEQVESAQVNDDTNLHKLDIVAQASARAVAGIDDALHALAASGMALLFAPPLVHYLQLTGVDVQFAGAGESAIGRINLHCTAQYYVRQSAPEVITS